MSDFPLTDDEQKKEQEDKIAKYTIKDSVFTNLFRNKRICITQNILKKYLESRKKEVIDIMMTLFDEETIRKNREASLIRETKREIEEKGIKGIVDLCLSLNASFHSAVERVMETFELDEKTSSLRVQKYWK